MKLDDEPVGKPIFESVAGPEIPSAVRPFLR